MTLLAFTYNDYYCNGIEDSFRGMYDDIEELFQLLKGGRWEHQNLETMDTKTHAINKYRWNSHYRYRDEYVPKDEKHPDGHAVFLQHKWDNTPEFEIFYDGEVRKYNQHNMHLADGHWDTNLEYEYEGD